MTEPRPPERSPAAATDPGAAAGTPAGPARTGLHDAAFVLLLACIAGRCFLGELPFRGSALQFVPRTPPASAATDAAVADDGCAFQADRTELSRMAFAALLLLAAALWLLGGAAGGRLVVRHAGLAGLIAAFAALSLASALAAADRRAALDGWIEQLALLAACFLAVQLCGERRRFAVLVAVLAAVGLALAAKGFWQRAVEIPDRVADFEAHRAERLAGFGWAAGTAQARLIETRLRDPAITGFFPLANALASLLGVLLLAAAGLAVEKVRRGLASWRAGRRRRRKGEVDLPVVAGAVAVLAAAAVAAAVLLTRSRGAIVAAAVAAAALAAVLRWRRALAQHWRGWLAAVAAAGLIAAGGLVALGLSRDALPTRTMTFRWHYWTASARMVRESPLLGVGPRNFADAYLACRRDEAEEEIQMPHNAVAHALAQYGVGGGACYLAILGWLLVGCARPRRQDAGPLDESPGQQRRIWPVLLAVLAAAAAARAWAAAPAGGAAMFVLEVAFPAAALGAALAATAWAPRGSGSPGGELSACRAALGCAAGGFLLHNLVTFSLWVPAPAGVFYVAAGACVARAGAGRPRGVRRGRWAIAALAVAAVAAVAVVFVLPIARKTSATAAMLSALRVGDGEAALDHARRAAEADGLDPRAAADAAEVAMMLAARPGADAAGALAAALELAETAVRLSPRGAAYHRLAGRVAWSAAARRNEPYARLVGLGDAAFRAGRRQAARDAWARAAGLARTTALTERAVRRLRRAVELNPKEPRLRVDCARVLCNASRPRLSLVELAEALRLDGCLLPDSVEKLTAAEHAEIALLRTRADVLLARPRTRPAIQP